MNDVCSITYNGDTLTIGGEFIAGCSWTGRDNVTWSHATPIVWPDNTTWTPLAAKHAVCDHCGSRSPDDTRGNCGACGAPRPMVKARELFRTYRGRCATDDELAETFAGKCAELQARVDETEQQIGRAFIPPLAQVAAQMERDMRFMDWCVRFWDTIARPFVWFGRLLA